MAPKTKNSKKKPHKATAVATVSASAKSKAGKTKNKKRAERIAQASPYQAKHACKGGDEKDEEEEVDDVEVVEVVEDVEDVEDVEMEQEASVTDSIGCRVFVGNFSWSTKAEGLKAHMQAAGPVEHAVVLGSNNGTSIGCGVVTYATEEAAKNAIATLQETELDGRKIFIREDRQAPVTERRLQASPHQAKHERKGGNEKDVEMEQDSSVGCRVFISNMSWRTKSEGLKAHMQAAGPVELATVLVSNGRSSGCGVVTYATEETAKKAIATLHDSELDGRKIFAREDRQAQPVFTPKPNRGTRVYVGNVDRSVKWQNLKDHMKKAGTVVYADILEQYAGRSKGSGLVGGMVEYATAEEAAKAIAELHDTELGGRLIFVREDREPEGVSISKLARRPTGSRQGGGRQLFVGNLPNDTNRQKLKDLFRTIGAVERADVAQDSAGRPRGFGTVRYSSAADASKAIKRLDGKELEGQAIKVRLDKRG
ncbi:hypothetical protein V7S43_015001 [Phytophthora oleae]|uniref:RRM domain-containing protein n=1 Tax=Phytophthora oleae TaxID=2107226 RepID=A0ABD3F4S0_9STRA